MGSRAEVRSSTSGRRSSSRGLNGEVALSLVRRHSFFLMVWVLVGFGILCGVVFSLTPAYQATAEVALDSRLRKPDDYSAVISGPFTLTEYEPVVRSEVQALESPALAERVIEQLHLGDVEEFRGHTGLRARLMDFISASANKLLPESVVNMFVWQSTPPDAAAQKSLLMEQYSNRLSVSNDGRSLTIFVKVWAADRYLAAKIANAHVQLYVDDQIALKDNASRRAMDRIDHQIATLGSDLKTNENELREYRGRQGLVQAMGSTLLAQQAAQINDRLSQARTDLAMKQASAAQLKHGGANQADVQSAVLNSQLIQRLREQESQLNTNLENLRSRYAESSPVVRTVQLEIAGVHSKIQQETARIATGLTADANVAQSRVNDLSAQLDSLRKQLANEDRSDVRAAAMERDIGAQSGVYRELLSRAQQIAAQEGQAQADARIVSPASVPRLPFYPKPVLFLSLGLLGLVGSGFGAAYLLERTQNGVEDLEAVNSARDLIHYRPIPLVPAGELKGRKVVDHVLDLPLAWYAESIRSLRGDVMYAPNSSAPRVLAFTSALPGEGKSTIAVSMGRSMAAAGLQVLLIDCDLRRPRCAELVGVKPSRIGLVSTLKGRSALEDGLIVDPKSSLNLLVPEDRVPSPQDLLGLTLRSLIGEAKEQFDVVILDTPPVAAVGDAFLVTQLADATVLIVGWRTTPASSVDNVITAYRERGLEITGLCLNRVNLEQHARIKGTADVHELVKSYYSAT